jgi:hypothetical protein
LSEDKLQIPDRNWSWISNEGNYWKFSLGFDGTNFQ